MWVVGLSFSSSVANDEAMQIKPILGPGKKNVARLQTDTDSHRPHRLRGAVLGLCLRWEWTDGNRRSQTCPRRALAVCTVPQHSHALYLFVWLVVSRTPDAAVESHYEGSNLRYPKALGPQGAADVALLVRRIPAPPLVGRQLARGIRASGLSRAAE